MRKETFKCSDGAKYKGQIKDGEPHGIGTKTWPDGDQHVGFFVRGKAHGQGKFTYADDGWAFEGQWIEDDLPIGTVTFNNG